MRGVWAISAAMLVGLCVCGVSAARAGEDDPIKLGPIVGYQSFEDAAHHCIGDGVVWADRKTGFLYPRFMEQYGKTPNGTFTCYQQARKADYWGFVTVDTMGMKGKSFPLVTCPQCS